MTHRLTHRGRSRLTIINLWRWALVLSLACGTPPALAQTPTAVSPTNVDHAVPPVPAADAATPAAADATAQSAPAQESTAPAFAPGAAAPAAVAAPDTTAPMIAPDADTTLPRDLSPLGMFMQADIIVKAVMIGLAFASVVTWSVWLAKTIELFGARRRARRDIARLAEAGALADAGTTFANVNSDVAMLCRAAVDEIRRSHDAMNPDGVKERVASHFSRIEIAAARRMTRGTGILATIGSTAPFVGLFGTVWGIMNAFIGISKAQTTNLAVVAPGIAEALLATALGLVAAIPAVIIFNMFARATAGYRGLLGDGAAELLRMVSRDLDRAGGFRHRAAAE